MLARGRPAPARTAATMTTTMRMLASVPVNGRDGHAVQAELVTFNSLSF